jgi:glycosyltransferase involved in cell wall biosynthesis
MLSIYAISRIKKPLIWTLHDTWAFSGAEHYDDGINRWNQGYSKKSRPPLDRGIDINRLMWILKSVLWRKRIGIVAPSEWMKDCVESSTLMSGWPVRVIPNPIDTEAWTPVDKAVAREILDLPMDRPLILFGAVGGTKDPRKGFDLFMDSIPAIRERIPSAHFIVFGEKPSGEEFGDFPMTFLGVLNDDLSLRLAYSSADVFVITSRQDNLPNPGIEAQACGTPVVAFEVGGLPDVVEHLGTGYLATPFNIEDLANGINWAYQQVLTGQIKIKCRTRAETVFSPERISEMYLAFYEEEMKAQPSSLKKNLRRKAN